jgi:hypothetical protein
MGRSEEWQKYLIKQNPSEKVTMDCMHDSLKAIVCAKLFIDVVEMIAQGLESNFFVMGNLHRLVAPPEQLENTPFFVGEWRDRCWSSGIEF